MYKSSAWVLYNMERKRISVPENCTLRLNRLERPQPWADDFLSNIMVNTPPTILNQYPDYDRFYSRLAQFLGRSEDEIVVGCGADEFIRNIMWMTCDSGDSAAVLWPTYAMYPIYAKMFSVNLIRVVPELNRTFDLQRLFDSVPTSIKVLFLPNPNQPVETHFCLDDLRILAQECKVHDILLVVDEAYHFFGGTSAIPLIDEFDNVVVIRSFSKAFGAAGLRLGYAVGSPLAIKPLKSFRLAGEVSALSMHVAAVLLDRFEEEVQPWLNQVMASRDWLRDAVKEHLNLEGHGRFGNWVLVEFPDPDACRVVSKRLQDVGVYVKADYPPPLDHCSLVTCGSLKMMNEFFLHLASNMS